VIAAAVLGIVLVKAEGLGGNWHGSLHAALSMAIPDEKAGARQ
jgi:hypothetical protein